MKNKKKMYMMGMWLMVGMSCMPVAGQECYRERRAKGIEAYNKGKYEEALRQFSSVYKCPTPPPRTNDIDGWMKKCKNARQKVIRERTSQTVDVSRPGEMRVIYTLWKTTCHEGMRGGEMTVMVATENMKGKTIDVRCDVNGKYEDGKKIQATAAEEDMEVTYFVPFDEIEWMGNYDDQVIATTVRLNAEGMKEVEHRDDYYVSPVSLTVGGSGSIYELQCDYRGGSIDLEMSGCSQRVIWYDMPEWVSASGTEMHIDANESPTERECRVTVRATPYGNPVSIVIAQGGRMGDVVPTVKINDVTYRYTMINGERALDAHVAFEIEDARGKEVRAYAMFYNENDGSQLVDEQGQWVCNYCKGNVTYSSSAFDDFPIQIYIGTIKRASNLKSRQRVKMYIAVTVDDGRSWLARQGPYMIEL